MHSSDALTLADCTGVTQAGLKLLAAALPASHALPADLREQYNPQMFYAMFDFPCPPGFDDKLRALDVRRSDARPEEVGHLLGYIYKSEDEHRSTGIIRRERGGGTL